MQAGARCKEVGSTPQILATLPLSYRYTDGAALSITSRIQSLRKIADALRLKVADLLEDS